MQGTRRAYLPQMTVLYELACSNGRTICDGTAFPIDCCSALHSVGPFLLSSVTSHSGKALHSNGSRGASPLLFSCFYRERSVDRSGREL